MVDWIKNEVEELKDWVVSGTVVDVKVWWVIAATYSVNLKKGDKYDGI